jgi:hypothetical protein
MTSFFWYLRPRSCWPVVALLSVGLLAGCKSDDPSTTSTPQGALDASGKIHGVVRVRVDDSLAIPVPGIRVYARGTGAGAATTEPASSDGNGRFVLPDLAQGSYLLCWEAEELGAGCREQPLQVEAEAVYAALELTASAVVYGRVSLADGSNPRVESPFLGASIHSYAVAVDRDGKPVSQTVRANDSGDYVLGGVPAGATAVRIEVEQSTALAPVSPGQQPVRADVRLENEPPVPGVIVAFQDDQAVRQVAPGASLLVTVEASDPDNDELHYQWGVSGSEGDFRSEDAPRVQWELPRVAGRHSIYVLVRDQRGGSAQRRLDVVTSEDGKVYFGGTLLDSRTQLPVAGVAVSVNGERTETDKEGGFLVSVPEAGSRYVLTLSKDGYQLYSRVLSEELMEDTYWLVPAFRAVIDPRQAAQVREEREDGRPGTQLSFEKGVLVDADGKPAEAPLTVYVATVDPQDPQGRMPGNMGALTLKGEDAGLITFGAVDVRIRDDQGRAYNVAPGRHVRVSIPVDPSLLKSNAKLPDQTPLWYYEETSGQWRQEEGSARREGDTYVIDAPHFSVLNADLQFSNAACLRVLIDTTKLTLPVKLRATVTTSASTTQVFTFLAADPLNLIGYLPPNQNVKLEVLDSLNHVINISTQNVSSGPPSGLGLPPYPYAACNSQVTMTLTLPSASNFLTHAGVDNAASASTYYTAIGAGAKPTLAAWKTANGFGTDDADAVYFNHGDLGFGRWMHMKKLASGNIAYYVSNYPSATAAALARLIGNPSFQLIATVGMEYSPLPSTTAPRVTKFYVYNNAGNLVPSADLDGAGQKFIPALCITCHGGVNGSPSTMNSRWLPFALESFRYATGIFTFFGYSRAAQEPRFRKLNEGLLSTNYTPAIQELVCRWHGAAASCTGPLPATSQSSGFVPAGWAARPALYSTVVQPSCRTCHVARLAPLDWARWDGPGSFDGFKEFGGIIKNDVCSSRIMPQAKRTYENLWLSTTPHQPATLANSGLDSWLPTDPCP